VAASFVIPAPALVAVLLLTGAPSAADRAECACLLDGATSAVEGAVRIFEMRRPGSPGMVAAAERALVAATDARDILEDAPTPAGCGPSRAEELIYLNHLIPGFRGWLDARARKPPADYDIASILRRARVHRERGRARLR
jgi:hypothetical protein